MRRRHAGRRHRRQQSRRADLPIVRELVRDIILVEEPLIERAVNAFLTLQKTMAEGAGAAGLAAMLAEPARFAGRKVGLILCGGNIDPRILASIMVRELEREDRIVSFRLTIPDRPGVLGQIASRLGELGANILGVDHHRLFLDVPAKGAKLDITMETRDGAHAEANFPRADRRRLPARAHGRRCGVGVKLHAIAPTRGASVTTAIRPIVIYASFAKSSLLPRGKVRRGVQKMSRSQSARRAWLRGSSSLRMRVGCRRHGGSWA